MYEKYAALNQMRKHITDQVNTNSSLDPKTKDSKYPRTTINTDKKSHGEHKIMK